MYVHIIVLIVFHLICSEALPRKWSEFTESVLQNYSPCGSYTENFFLQCVIVAQHLLQGTENTLILHIFLKRLPAIIGQKEEMKSDKYLLKRILLFWVAYLSYSLIILFVYL